MASNDLEELEGLMREWSSRRRAEESRRTTFVHQRDDALAVWRRVADPNETDSRFIDYRLGRNEMALAEILEIEHRSGAAFENCREAIAALAQLSDKELKRSVKRLTHSASLALREDMRYLSMMLSAFQNEVTVMVDFIEEHAPDPSA